MSHANPVHRRRVLELLGAGLVGAGFGDRLLAQPLARTSGSGDRPNLILFFPDECRADALASYGNPICRTPNFDLLARQGTRFAQCHVQFPVCGASRCSLLTGLPTANTGHRSLYYFLRRDEPNLFRYLKDGGYDTFMFGHNDALAPESFPLSLTEWHDEPIFGGGARPDAGNHLPQGVALDDPRPLTMMIGAKVDRRKMADYRLLQRAINVLERREQDRPFCIFLPLYQPHPPYLAPEGFDTMYKPGDLPPLAPPGMPRKPKFHEAIRKAYKLDKATDADLRQVRATYLGQVSYSDWLLGELMEAIERTGHTGDTVLVAASDHGDYAGDYGLVEKWPSGLETCLTHVPLVARMPGGRQGHVVNEMVELYDIMATFLDLGGVEARHTHFARSFVPQLKGAAGDPRRAAFSEGGYNIFEPQAFEPPMGAGVRNFYTAKREIQNGDPATVTRASAIATPDFRFIARPGGQSELYDRRKDPLETRNLIEERSYAKVREDMQERLLNRYVTTTGVPPIDRDPRATPEFTLESRFENAEDKARALLDQ